MPESKQIADLTGLFLPVGVNITDNQKELFQKYLDLLLSWNKRINLISRKDEARLVESHILESLACLLSFRIPASANIIDVGSGAGFPALPLSLICCDAHFLLIESKRLKALFLSEVVDRLQLANVAVLCERVENLSADDKYLGQFDFAFSRAVSSLKKVYGWIQAALKPAGYYIAWKGGDVRQEIEDLKGAYPNVRVAIRSMDKRIISPDKKKLFVQVQRISSTQQE